MKEEALAIGLILLYLARGKAIENLQAHTVNGNSSALILPYVLFLSRSHFVSQAMLWHLYEKGSKIIHLKHPAHVKKPSSPRAIFITSGTPSKDLPLTPIMDVSGSISSWHTLIITDRIAGKDSSVIFRGVIDGLPVIVKVAEFDEVPLLSREAHVYTTLTR